jgi:hypothetical protein
MKRPVFIAALAVTAALPLLGLLLGPSPRAASGGHQIEVRPWGPTQDMIDATTARVAADPAVQLALRGGRQGLLSFELMGDERPDSDQRPPDRYLATFFDYTHNRAFVASGPLEGGDVKVTPTFIQPEPSEDEFNEAVAILSGDARFGPALRAGTLVAYPPMPPLGNADLPVGQTDRIVNVGLVAKGATEPKKAAAGGKSSPRPRTSHEIVGVNMIRRQLVSAPERGTARAIAAEEVCGPPNARQSTTRRGTAGSFNVIIQRDGVELWNFLVVRPSASSGRRASGIELRNVRHRGKLVFSRAHVPVLNVHYQADRCGPFRDWQWQEGAFVADGVDVAPGIRQTTSPPLTLVETGMDQGNFRGVAMFDSGSEVQLVTEMNAAWYRYVMKWFLRDDGVIQPRFGFGAVENSCVCNLHFHNTYWRFDFDVVQGGDNSVCVADGDNDCQEVSTETRLQAIPSHLEIRNNLGNEAIRLTPGPGDGLPDTYAKGTAWILAKQSSEIDDGVNCTSGNNCHTEIDIDRFVDGEDVSAANLVVWYRASFRHQNEDSALQGTADHIVGPELRALNW